MEVPPPTLPAQSVIKCEETGAPCLPGTAKAMATGLQRELYGVYLLSVLGPPPPPPPTLPVQYG